MRRYKMGTFMTSSLTAFTTMCFSICKNMAKGRGRKSSRGSKRKRPSKFANNLSKKHKNHVREFGEMHPAECSQSEHTKYKKIYDETRLPKRPLSDDEHSSSENDDSVVEVNPLTQLLSTFTNKSNDGNVSPPGSDDDTKTDESSNEENSSEKELLTADILPAGSETDDELSEPGNTEQQENEEMQLQPDDPFRQHFENILPEAVVDSLNKKESWTTKSSMLPAIGNVLHTYPTTLANCLSVTKITSDLEKLWIKPTLHTGWKQITEDVPFTALQKDIYPIISHYKDLLFCARNASNGESIRSLYCLHVLNHILKTRNKIVHHNSNLGKHDDVLEEFRDQGLTRPKVLILVPFRESALRIVKNFISILLPGDKANVVNKKRFLDEFGSKDSRKTEFRYNPKPPDHETTFAGNTDDSFRIGVAVTKKSLRLYADFYSSDIIVASPLGLRILVGAEGEKNREYDFLSSIEVLIIDQAEVMLMQNWEHLLHSLAHFHLQPKESHGVDFSRVRLWTLNGWAKFYRQTLCFTSIVCPEFNSLFNRTCCNFEGIFRTQNPIVGGSIQQVAAQLPQVFQRFQVSSLQADPEMRFQYFVSKILPQFKEAVMKRTLIFVPSYFDFVRLRNYFRKEELSFVQICEYTEDGKVAQARTRFYERQRKFLLYTERAHFYKRYRVKGIQHIIFYQLPIFPHFYSEICNFPQLFPGKTKSSSHQINNLTCTVIFSQYDIHRLAAIVGTDSAAQMLSSQKDVHLFITGDS